EEEASSGMAMCHPTVGPP
ncbi:hypothetical protein A2U01_0097603, partial [Trifolium medium]|nr:hypothetical protein [Trifolium medium]